MSTHGYFNWASLSYCCQWSLLMYVCRLMMAPLCAPMGTPMSQFGVVQATCMQGGLARVAPLFASWSTILFPIMPVCAMTFWILI